MHPRSAGLVAVAILAAGLLLGWGTPVALADRLPTIQPKDRPFDSDPEVPNQAWMTPETVDGTQAEDARIVRSSPKNPWLFQLRRWALYFFTRVGGGMPR
jgi:hypothetical protein